MSQFWRFAGKVFAGFAIAASLCFGSASFAQSTCDFQIVACDIAEDAICLEKNYACGELDRILSTLFVEDIAPTVDQKFYIGASFYGKHLRERAQGARCEMVRLGRNGLFDYLNSAQAQFQEAGNFGNLRQMRQLYLATQMYSGLQSVAGCPQSALSRARIKSIAEAEARSYAENVFLAPPDEVKDAFGSLQQVLKSFVSKASDLETGVALREVELDAAAARLAAIRGLFEVVFGAVSGAGTTLQIDQSVLDVLTQTANDWKRRVEVQHANFSAALNGVSVEEYAARRLETLSMADAFMKASAIHINMIGKLMPIDPDSAFGQLEETLDAEGPGKSLSEDMAKIRGDWNDFGENSGLCQQPLAADRFWYCR